MEGASLVALSGPLSSSSMASSWLNSRLTINTANISIKISILNSLKTKVNNEKILTILHHLNYKERRFKSSYNQINHLDE